MIEPTCKDCGLEYKDFGVDLVLANQDWERIATPDDMLCANCISKRCDKIGAISLLAWIRKE